MELYTSYRSIAAHRVRIALNYKGVSYTPNFIHMDQSGMVDADYRFRTLNPQGLAPVLLDEGQVITQSMAIMEYLEERFPSRPMLPPDIVGRARVRSLAQLFIADIQPLSNLRVMRYLREELDCDETQVTHWYGQWVMEGLEAAEILLVDNPHVGIFCHGDKPTIADACLVPQVHDAVERKFNLEDFPTVRRIYRTCLTLGSFQSAAPETQADATAMEHIG
jgi:maleylacetoacetate isomerase